ncbi:MAG: hypothetical protein QXY40_01505 [Candidatus Methanomethylicia archaeon]
MDESIDDLIKDMKRIITRIMLNPEAILLLISPNNLREPYEHLLNAKIEFLKAIRSIIDERISSLEKIVEENRRKLESKRETVKVE